MVYFPLDGRTSSSEARPYLEALNIAHRFPNTHHMCDVTELMYP